MKILKEISEENKCPKCKTPLDFQGYEREPEFPFGLIKWTFSLGIYDTKTGNQWFRCDKCNTRFLIEGAGK